MSVLIRGGRVIDETGERDADVLVRDGVIAEVGPGLDAAGATVLDADGAVVAPGLVDIQVHFREPGREDAETLETGARAAALGGFTAVVAMPNTTPPLDDAKVVGSVLEHGRRTACLVTVAGCITRGREGRELAPLGELYDLGVRIFTDDGDCVADANVMRRALEYSSALPGAVIAQHAEDPAMVAGGHMHEGEWSARLGIPGRPAAAEVTIVARDLELARITGGRYHVLHMSTAGATALVRAAKAEGVRVTAEASPQHFTLTDAECASFDPVFKMNPPLRSDADVEAIVAGLVDGTIDAIATDHAPHTPATKELPFEEAPPGMLGVETALAVSITRLSDPGTLTLADVLARLSWQPARIAGLDALGHGLPVAVGNPANLCVIDPAETWVVEADRSASKSRNTPWAGWKLTGRVRHTVLRGQPVVINREAHA
ncbi:MAG: dihydroorotase [Acidimicrobiia bacterium]|nr:dihydroorotase [Acidimicrobiia bacterium]